MINHSLFAAAIFVSVVGNTLAEDVSDWSANVHFPETEKRVAPFNGKNLTRPIIKTEELKVVGWPTYAHDDLRSNTTTESADPPLALQWVLHTRHKPEPAWPPPAKQDFWHGKSNLRARVDFDRAFHVVSDGKRVYFGSSADDQVRALDLITGKTTWSFFAEGPVRLAPTISNDRVYFGSDDGRVYCLNAEDGVEQWRFDASASALDSPARVLPGNSRMISMLPVRTGVIVNDGSARFGAGLFPQQGVYQFVVNAETGKLQGHGKLNFSPQGYLQRTGDGIRIAQGRAPETVFERTPLRGKPTAAMKAMKVAEKYPYASIVAGDIQFSGGDGVVAALKATSDTPVWEAKVDGKAYSLAVAGGRLLVSTDAGIIYCFAPKTDNAKPAIEYREPTAEFPWASDIEREQFHRWSKATTAHLNSPAGYCLLIGGDARHAYALSQRMPLQIVVMQDDTDRAAKIRKQLAAAGVYGRITVRYDKRAEPPFAKRLFNLVVLADEAVWSESATAKLVRPYGGLFVDAREKPANWDLPYFEKKATTGGDATPAFATYERSALEGAGEWTHMYGSPSNTSCSNDTQVQGKLALQWFGPPGPRNMLDRHHRGTPPLSSHGRLFAPGNEYLYGIDAFNGAILWEKSLPGFRRVGAPRDGGNLAAAHDLLYAVAKDRCHAIDTNRGETRSAFSPPAMTDGKPRHWGMVAVMDDALVGSTTQPNASRSGHSRGQIDETYYDHVPIIVSDSLFSLNRHSGDPKWRYIAKGAILNPTITFGGGRCYFLESRDASTISGERKGRIKLTNFVAKGADLVALDLKTGGELWRKEADVKKIEHHLFLAYAAEKLVMVGTRNESGTVRYDLSGTSAKTGKAVWSASQDQGQRAGGSHGEQDHHLAILGDKKLGLTVVQEPYAYDLHTGEKRKDWKFALHGCGSISASATAFFYRAANPTMCDLATGTRSKVNTVSRPGCWINIIPANGLLLIPEASSGCTCNYSIQSSMAFAPE